MGLDAASHRERRHDLWMSLRIASAWRFRLAFESPLPQARAYDWTYRNDDMRVTKNGLPFIATDGRRELRLADHVYRAGRVKFLSEMAWLRSGGEGFTFEWGMWCAEWKGDFDGVRIAVEGQPHERYLVRTHAPPWRVGLRTHVSIEALEGRANVDRMAALLAYFWTDARARHGSAG